MYYLVIIDDGDYRRIEFRFGSWEKAQEFIDTALLHGEWGKMSVTVKLMEENEEEEEERKENK